MAAGDDERGIFSLDLRRQIEREKYQARGHTLAWTKRILGRLLQERRVLEAQAELVRVERRACEPGPWKRSARNDFSALVDVLRAQVRRLLTEDGPALHSATEEVARAIPGPDRQDAHENAAERIPQPATDQERSRANGSKGRSPWG